MKSRRYLKNESIKGRGEMKLIISRGETTVQEGKGKHCAVCGRAINHKRQ